MLKEVSKLANKWEPIIMAGLGAAVAQIDPSLDARTMILLVIKGFVGAAVGAYMGNHLSSRKEKKKSKDHL